MAKGELQLLGRLGEMLGKSFIGTAALPFMETAVVAGDEIADGELPENTRAELFACHSGWILFIGLLFVNVFLNSVLMTNRKWLGFSET